MSIDVSKKIVMMPINKVKPYVRNPRKNDKTVAVLVDIIPKVGFNQPIVIDKNGVIVKGHARFSAALKLGMTEVPCIVTDADEEAIKLDRIADNKVSELSEWIDEDLFHELDMLNIDFDLTQLGLPNPTIDDVDFDFDVEEREPDISEEERKKLYEEFLKKQAEAEPQETITTQADIDRAKESQKNVASEAPRYYKVVCEHCGHIMFVKEGDICDRVE